MILEGIRAKRETEMADQSGKPTETIFDVSRLMEALKRIAAENAPIHAAISALHRQYKNQPRAYQIHIWDE